MKGCFCEKKENKGAIKTEKTHYHRIKDIFGERNELCIVVDTIQTFRECANNSIDAGKRRRVHG